MSENTVGIIIIATLIAVGFCSFLLARKVYSLIKNNKPVAVLCAILTFTNTFVLLSVSILVIFFPMKDEFHR